MKFVIVILVIAVMVIVNVIVVPGEKLNLKVFVFNNKCQYDVYRFMEVDPLLPPSPTLRIKHCGRWNVYQNRYLHH